MAHQRSMSKMRRLEMMVETTHVPAVLEVIMKHASGYSLVPNVTGFGRHGYHPGDITLVVTITTSDHVDRIVDGVLPLLNQESGVVLVTDVLVARVEHFVPEMQQPTKVGI
jgi:hypothetical protein